MPKRTSGVEGVAITSVEGARARLSGSIQSLVTAFSNGVSRVPAEVSNDPSGFSIRYYRPSEVSREKVEIFAMGVPHNPGQYTNIEVYQTDTFQGAPAIGARIDLPDQTYPYLRVTLPVDKEQGLVEVEITLGTREIRFRQDAGNPNSYHEVAPVGTLPAPEQEQISALVKAANTFDYFRGFMTPPDKLHTVFLGMSRDRRISDEEAITVGVPTLGLSTTSRRAFSGANLTPKERLGAYIERLKRNYRPETGLIDAIRRSR